MKHFLIVTALWIPVIVWRLSTGQAIGPIIVTVSTGLGFAAWLAAHRKSSVAATICWGVIAVAATSVIAHVIDAFLR